MEFLRGPGSPIAVCACGDTAGANFYAFRDAKLAQTGLIIQLAARIEDVCVDARDFLFSAFQGWDDIRTDLADKQARDLEAVFGEAIRAYFDRARASDKRDQDQRIALCSLASQDPAVVLGHARSRTRVLGRYGTLFCSAFLVRAPVLPEAIRDISEATGETHRPVLLLDEFLGRVPAAPDPGRCG